VGGAVGAAVGTEYVPSAHALLGALIRTNAVLTSASRGMDAAPTPPHVCEMGPAARLRRIAMNLAII